MSAFKELPEKVQKRINDLLDMLNLESSEGEKKNAESFLQVLLEKYDLSMDDLTLEEKKKRNVWWDTLAEKQLQIQIFGMLFGRKRTLSSDLTMYRSNNYATEVNLTDMEWIEYEQHWHHYKRIYRAELKKARETVLHAVCSKYQLHWNDDRTPEEIQDEEERLRLAELEKLSKMTPDELKEYEELKREQRRKALQRAAQAGAMADGMEHKGLYKQLED